MAAVTLDNLHVHFGDVAAVDGVDLHVEDGEFIVFLGPSGCGKTTTLRCIAGLEEPTSGDIRFDGQVVNSLDAVHRNVAMVFQFISLYPHLTIRKNIAFPLQARRMPRQVIEEKIDWVTRIFDLQDILDQRPRRLPPGARQKAALARSVVRDPNVLLLDEPLSAIDEQFREEMRWELRHLQKELGVTSVYVTHDQREAMSLADRIVLMNDGKIVQVGAPSELFDEPINAFAGYFIGSPAMNFFQVKRDGDAMSVLGSDVRIRLPEALMSSAGTQQVQLGIRPQYVSIGSDNDTEASFHVPLISRQTIGREYWFDFEIAGEQYKGMSDSGLGETADMKVKLDVERLLLFSRDGERIQIGTK